MHEIPVKTIPKDRSLEVVYNIRAAEANKLSAILCRIIFGTVKLPVSYLI